MPFVDPSATEIAPGTAGVASVANDRAASADPIRVAIQQPSLPKYRVPLYQHLASLPGVSLTLQYGSEEPALRNVAPDGFAGEMTPFSTLSAGPLGKLFWHPAQWRVVDRRYSDVAILCWNARFLSLLPALIRARLNGVPTALWGHGFSKAEASWRARLRWLPARLATALIFYDFNTARQWAAEGLPEEKIFVAPNGLDSERIARAAAPWREDPAALARFRDEHLADAGPVMIYIGRIQPENRLDLAIDGLAELSRTHPGARLVVIGKGAPEEALRQQATERGVGEQVVWVGERYDEAEIAPWMLSADVLVYPSNAGLSLIHGFNYGLPAIACAPRTAHNPEIWALEDGRNGVVTESADGSAIAMACRQIADDPQGHQAMRASALDSARSTYNLAAVGRTFERLIRYLASQRPGRSERITTARTKG